MMRSLLPLAAAIWIAGCTACQDEAQKNGAPGTFSVPPPVNPRLEPIPTEEDFEEAAIAEIKPEQLEAELNRLEREIKP